MPPLTQKTRHIIPISGKDSLCTAVVQMNREPNLDYEFMFCDVRSELPETYEWLAKVEQKLGVKITRVGRNLELVIDEMGVLPSAVRRYCTKLAKIDPLHKHVGRGPVVQYLGFRADEQDRIPSNQFNPPNITVRYPLIEMGIDITQVYAILEKLDVLPPTFFWQRLYDEVYDMAGYSSKKFIDNVPPWARSYLFSWRSRSNCYFCFYQRLYEWVGLLEHHPDLFAKAEEIEETYGSAGSEFRIEKYPLGKELTDDFHFRQGYPLKKVRENAEDIYRKKVAETWKQVVEARHLPDVDVLTFTSCGALCGK